MQASLQGMKWSPRKRAARLTGSFSSALPFVILLAAWQLVAVLHVFPKVLFPSIETVVTAMWHMALSGALWKHIYHTLARIGIGFGIAVVIGTSIGLGMGIFRPVERFFGPLFTVLLPVPVLAWLPLFILWAGIGNTPCVILVIFASSQYIAFNTYTGVRSINPVWLRAARSMNIHGLEMVVKIIIPGSLPMILSGLRLGVAQAWRADIAGEMIAATHWGLGFVIFNAVQYLQTQLMLGSIVVISMLGLILERLTFRTLEARTAERWGTITNPNELAEVVE